MTTNNPNEKELFLQIAEGDESAFREIFHIYNAKLYPGVLSITGSETEAEEITQNVFLKLWLNRTSLLTIENHGGWLYRIASNLALTSLRAKASSLRHIKMLESRHSETYESLELQLDAVELKNLIDEAVEKLPPGRRKVFTLSRHEGLDRRQIAQQTGLSESTVKNQLTSALKFIQSYIENKNGIYLPAIFFLPFY